VLDMATSTVPRGKLEVYNRKAKEMPLGWATDEQGVPTTDAARVLDNFTKRAAADCCRWAAPARSSAATRLWHGMLVEILSAVLPGAAYLNSVYPRAPTVSLCRPTWAISLAPGGSTPSARPTSSRPTWTTWSGGSKAGGWRPVRRGSMSTAKGVRADRQAHGAGHPLEAKVVDGLKQIAAQPE